ISLRHARSHSAGCAIAPCPGATSTAASTATAARIFLICTPPPYSFRSIQVLELYRRLGMDAQPAVGAYEGSRRGGVLPQGPLEPVDHDPCRRAAHRLRVSAAMPDRQVDEGHRNVVD